LSGLAAFEEPNNGVERARLTVADLASLSARAAHAERYPVVRLYLASLSAHEKSAPVQFMVGLR
jgi:hypothetical protein